MSRNKLGNYGIVLGIIGMILPVIIGVNSSTVSVPITEIEIVNGKMWRGTMNNASLSFYQRAFFRFPNNFMSAARYEATLQEDGREVGFLWRDKAEIASLGAGRFYIKNAQILFSTFDNSNPLENSRSYDVHVKLVPRIMGMAVFLAAFILFGFSCLLLYFSKPGELSRNFWLMAISCVIGGSVFIAIAGTRTINPVNNGWLMFGGGDISSTYLSTTHFHNTPLLQWPIGDNYANAVGASGSVAKGIIFGIAMFGKLLTIWLPVYYQYIGIWLFICFVLQAYFAIKLLSLFTKNYWLPLIGSIFFAMSPPMLWRLVGHYQLNAHFVLVAALYLYFRARYSVFDWSLLVLGTIVFPGNYLMPMVFLLFLADLGKRFYLGENKFTQTMAHFLLMVTSSFFACLALGYFGVGVDDYVSSGFGTYRMNLLSPINPHGGRTWTSLIGGNLVDRDGEYEGFNFMGLGMIVLGVMAIFGFLTYKNPNNTADNENKDTWKVRLMPLLIVCAYFFIYALSNRITFGAYDIITLPERLYWPMDKFFRVSGRFFWPILYLLYAGIFVVFYRQMRIRTSIIIFLLLALAQISDSRPMYKELRRYFKYSAYHSPLKSPAWGILAKQYNAIRYTNPSGTPFEWAWEAFGLFSAMNNMVINTSYVTRPIHSVNMNSLRLVSSQILALITMRIHSMFLIRHKRISGSMPQPIFPLMRS